MEFANYDAEMKHLLDIGGRIAKFAIVAAGPNGTATEFKPNHQTTTMGDKSPKANQKKSSQKQAKASSSAKAKKPSAAGAPSAGKK